MNQSFWHGRSVFVTGGGGFIGGWLVAQLLERGADVVVLVRDRNPRSMLERDALWQRVTTVCGCLEDLPLLRRALTEHSVRTVFHLAAQPLVGAAKLDVIQTLKTNIEGTWNVLEAARLAGAGETLVASSAKAYGSGFGARPPYRETYPLQGRYPYDVSKSCADLISSMYACTYKLPVAVLRCANLFGGGDLNFTRTIPGVIRSAVAGERFRIRSDGQSVRDFLYVKDAVRAYLTVAEQLARRPDLSGQAFNFTMAEPLTVLQIVTRVLKLIGRADLEPIVENRAAGEAREQHLSFDKAREVLGWKPLFGLDEALRETINWYADYFAEIEPQLVDAAAEVRHADAAGSAPPPAAACGVAAGGRPRFEKPAREATQ